MYSQSRKDRFLYLQTHIDNSCNSEECPQEIGQDITSISSRGGGLSPPWAQEGAQHCYCCSLSGLHLAGMTQARPNRGFGPASCVVPSSLYLSVVCFQCFGCGQRLRVSLPRSRDERLLLTQALGVIIILTPLLQVQSKITWENRTKPRLFLWTSLSGGVYNGQGQAASQKCKT